LTSLIGIINFLTDIINFIKLKKVEKNFEVGFFCENKFILNYLSPYILNKIKKKNVLIISFEKLNNLENKKISIFVFKTNFIRELIFLTIKLKYLYSSTPDLENSLFKKSKFSNCKYIYLQHSPVSLNLIYNENAFDSFDAIQTISDYQYSEFNEIKKLKKLKARPFKSEYLFIKNVEKKLRKPLNDKIDVIIAPSWNTGFYELNCHESLHRFLREKNISYKLRPHPMSFKKKEISVSELNKSDINLDKDEHIDFKNFNFLISDWSGIFIEYALICMKKSYLINTPKKDKNSYYKRYSNVPVEISMRNDFANTFDVDKIENLVEKIFKFKIENNFSIKDEKLIEIIKKRFY
tara:strand:+ start:893 stop:1945 length:1053 start_codon:yes stop_codon:yes gene_type:complete